MGNKSKAPLRIYSTLHICLIRHASITCSSITIYVRLPLSRCVLFLLLTNSWRGCRGRHHKKQELASKPSLGLLLFSSIYHSISACERMKNDDISQRGDRTNAFMDHLTLLFLTVPNVSSFIAISALGTYPRDFFESPAFLPLLAPPFSRLSYYYQQCTFWSTISHVLD